ncbi:hypothetical protein FHR88_000404 [Bradyrhizobium betae]|nr:hypothetical protein [Bradyrhizobium betae]
MDVGHIGATVIAGRETVSEAHRTHDRCDLRTAKSCGPGARRLASSVAVMWRPDRARASSVARRRGQECIAPRGERDISRQATAQGRPDVLATPVCRCANSCCHLSHSGPWVPAGTRSSLRPLSFWGKAMKQSSGKTSREAAKACLTLQKSNAATSTCPSPSPPRNGVAVVAGGARLFGEPRRATARLHLGRSSFEAPGAMLGIAPLAPQDDGMGIVAAARFWLRSQGRCGNSCARYRSLVPRTLRSATSAVRCRAGAHPSARCAASWVPTRRSARCDHEVRSAPARSVHGVWGHS